MPDDRPYRGESFADFARRVGPAPAAPRQRERAEPSPFPGVDANTRARESWRRRSLQPVRPPRVRIHRDMREFLRAPPAEYSGPTSMNVREIPQALNPILRQPRRGVGLIQWGADGRREARDILGDVETVAGAPAGLLTALGGRESDFDQRARNPKSSAQGPFQFIASTWRQWARGVLPIYGLPASMADEEMLWQREDWAMSGAATAELARYHDGELRRAMPGRAVSVADLYMMHFSGSSLAMLRDLHGGRAKPLAATYYSPAEIAANPALQLGLSPQQFYDRHTRLGRADALSREPVEFRPRLDGSTARFVPGAGGMLQFEE